jgi:26S proteasome regulatory subunit N5
MSKMEKQEFLLEQIRLVLAKKDYVRAYILSLKVNRKLLDEEESFADVKIRFYALMIQYYRHERDAFEISKCYKNVFSSPSIYNSEEGKWQSFLKATVAFLILSPHGNEQHDMLHRIYAEAKLDELEPFKKILKLFITNEIISYPFENIALISDLPEVLLANDEDDDKEAGTAFWRESLTQRVLQHNIRVAAKYYTRIRGSRLAAMLQLAPSVLETEIASMVSSGAIYAKIDRPKDIIRFSKEKSSEEVLSSWSSDISTLLNMVENTTHLIAKEMMINGLS